MLSAYLARLTHHLYKQQCYCETVPGKGSSRACCQNEVSEHYSFLSHSLIFPPSLCLLHSLPQLYFVLPEHKTNKATRSTSSLYLHLYPLSLCMCVVGWRAVFISFNTTERQQLVIFLVVSKSVFLYCKVQEPFFQLLIVIFVSHCEPHLELSRTLT